MTDPADGREPGAAPASTVTGTAPADRGARERGGGAHREQWPAEAEGQQATGGSVLAAGVLHAAFNASGQLGFPGGWQFLPALVVLALGVGLHRRFR